jgi:hypothetical protein
VPEPVPAPEPVGALGVARASGRLGEILGWSTEGGERTGAGAGAGSAGTRIGARISGAGSDGAGNDGAGSRGAGGNWGAGGSWGARTSGRGGS